MNNRRNFIRKVAVSAAMPAIFLNRAFGQAPPPVKLVETDPVAIALGYKADTNKVDAAKYPKHTAEQICGSCALYLGKPGDATGPCGAVGGKLVAVGGWCQVWAKKPEPVKS